MKQLILFLVSVVACQAATTRVLDTIQYPDGTFPTGRATISWGSFTSASSVAVAGGERIITITSGVVDVRLEPNLNAIPSSTCYTVTYNLPRGSYQECWVVPVSASAVTVSSIRTVAYPTIITSLSQIATAGLAAGDILYYNGSAVTRLPRSSVNGQALTIDTSLSTYLKWATVSGSGGGAIANIHTTFSAASSVAMTVSGGSTLAAMPACFNTGVSPPVKIEPDHIEITDADTITAFFSGTYTGYCNVNVGSSSSTNTHATFASASSVAVDLTGVSNASITPGCWNTAASPVRLFEPDHVELTDSNTVTIFFSGTYTGYCNVNTGS